ncbi:MAG: class I SAM-dependent methyltransferase [Gemmatimonadaceae bacterium]|nr:class I SAM-dependent methyltransferase [Gemmatimonadaceae bacterium]
MERDAFALMAAAERDHWWFRGRREFIEAAITRVAPPSSARLLDAGCGSGGNLALLNRFGTVYGFEHDVDALSVARARGVGELAPGVLPTGIPFGDAAFDVIGLFDVLEHLEQPVAALSALSARLAHGGAIVLTVPANPWLWGPHDVHHQHVRRYTAATLREHVAAAGLRVEYLSYFNALLLPLAIAQRVRERLFGYRTDALMPGPFVNRALLNVWRLEAAWIPQRVLPFGLSLLAIVRASPDHRA